MTFLNLLTAASVAASMSTAGFGPPEEEDDGDEESCPARRPLPSEEEEDNIFMRFSTLCMPAEAASRRALSSFLTAKPASLP